MCGSSNLVLHFVVASVITKVVSETITDVDVFPTKFIVRTRVSDNGNNDNVNVRIILTNLHDGSKPAGESGRQYEGPFQLDAYRNRNGGRYELTGLQPNTWYSINFTSVRREPTYAKYNYNLIKKTPTLAGVLNEEVVNVTAHRTGDSGQILQLSAKALGEAARLFEFLINSELICESSDKDGENTGDSGQKKMVKNLVLKPDESEADAYYEIEQVEESKSQSTENPDHIVATLKPTHCKKVCWKTWMRLAHSTALYSEVAGKGGCRVIEETVVTRAVRLFRGISATTDTLHIHTEYRSTQAETKPTVRVMVKRLNMGDDDTTAMSSDIHKRSTTSEPEIEREFYEGRNEYKIGGLHNDTWYVMSYDYAIERPIRYSPPTIQRLFKTESVTDDNSASNGNDIGDDDPVDLIFEPDTNSGTMVIKMKRSKKLQTHDVDVKMLPFCDGDGRRFRLENNDTTVKYTLNITRALQVMRERQRNATEHTANNNGTDTETTTTDGEETKCDQMCFNYELLVGDVWYMLANKCRSFAKIITSDGGGKKAAAHVAATASIVVLMLIWNI